MKDLGIKNDLSNSSSESLGTIETEDGRFGKGKVVANMEEIALKALHVDDDPTLNPWTFRMFFLGQQSSHMPYRLQATPNKL